MVGRARGDVGCSDAASPVAALRAALCRYRTRPSAIGRHDPLEGLGPAHRRDISSSTLRFGLTALLWEQQGWTPRVSPSGRYELSSADNEALSRWQVAQLRVCWRPLREPWVSEAEAVRDLRPPMNRADNADHPFYLRMGAARDRLRAVASGQPIERCSLTGHMPVKEQRDVPERIRATLDAHLRGERMPEISAVAAAAVLDRAGVLADSGDRPGLPLRRYLRDGRIANAYQTSARRWFIRRTPES
jgi:hypothetical protein